MKNKKLKVGDTLGGRYRIEGLLGEGGMSHVYLAEDLKLKGKKWAVKECYSIGTDAQTFLDEAEMLAQLQHPQLPQLIDYFITETDEIAYLVMDYIQGPTLHDVFERNGRVLSVESIIRYALQLCDLFHYLHSFRPRAIIFRDLKPGNVMINEHDQVRLIDFGVARHFTAGKHADTLQLGTIGFASPEQLNATQTDPRSDLYTLGAMMFYLLSGGKYPYLTQTPLAELFPDLPKGLTDTVQMLLQENPQNRCQSAAEVKQRLNGLQPPTTNSKHKWALNKQRNESALVTNKLIVVGGLYAGVGATFTAVSLARVLNASGIPQALVEQPTNEPDLYMLLFGDSKAPEAYKFASDMTDSIIKPAHGLQWENGLTTWVPTNPLGLSNQAGWTGSDSLKLLYAIKKPVVIWDISANWEEASVQELCRSADEILVVVDASPGKLNRSSSRAHMDRLMGYRTHGKSVRFIANRKIPAGIRREWLDSLSHDLLCMLPEIPYDQVMKAIWRGDCIQDQPLIMDKLKSAFQPLISEMFSVGMRTASTSKSKSLFSVLKMFSEKKL
ncbi:serine/threonine protein kinase [Paenibacillus eucommiae]|uniref:non-specific serine/threonine protein kinase n=1 Tax=Paenibacillus eucommiae TaxID=1355755 RepID=A0ABS4J608_9BACL|nr:serine/threonine-protein kinase [Paenibacillus eucommiae]MBP1995235.1 serine/threonine-protein kinase [Paenibacillus eucommiae]